MRRLIPRVSTSIRNSFIYMSVNETEVLEEAVWRTILGANNVLDIDCKSLDTDVLMGTSDTGVWLKILGVSLRSEVVNSINELLHI